MPVTNNTRQAGQSVKTALIGSHFMDEECKEIVPEEEDASLTMVEINMLLADSTPEDEIE